VRTKKGERRSKMFAVLGEVLAPSRHPGKKRRMLGKEITDSLELKKKDRFLVKRNRQLAGFPAYTA